MNEQKPKYQLVTESFTNKVREQGSAALSKIPKTMTPSNLTTFQKNQNNKK